MHHASSSTIRLAALAAFLLVGGAGEAAFAQATGGGGSAIPRRNDRPFVVAEQGSFSVGGHTVQGAGVFDPTKSPAGTNEGQTFWVDQTYVQYQKPENPPPVSAGPGSWRRRNGPGVESTPDGREGYQTIFLRKGYSVYIVDFARRGRSGQPTFNGPFGQLDGAQVVPNETGKTGVQFGWTRWRLGPVYPEVFPVQQFPMDQPSIDQFFQSLVPTVSDDATVITDGLVALLDKIGPAIIVTHSQSGLFGWLLAMRRPSLVKAVISYEPGFVFPQGELPPPIPLYTGAMTAGNVVSRAQFANLTRMPLQVVYGDNIPTQPIPDLVADGRRAQVVASRLFEAAVERASGEVEVLHLPDAGLYGNSHFAYSDLNNLDVADELSRFLKRYGLDRRANARR